MALQDPMDSRTANSSAWAQMAGVIMRFSKHPGYKDFQPPSGLSPRQRAVLDRVCLLRSCGAIFVSTSIGRGAERSPFQLC